MSITDKEHLKREVVIERRYTAHVKLKDFCTFAKDSEYIEITNWTNHEGYDIFIQRDGKRLPDILQLTCGEFDAIRSIIKQLDKV